MVNEHEPSRFTVPQTVLGQVAARSTRSRRRARNLGTIEQSALALRDRRPMLESNVREEPDGLVARGGRVGARAVAIRARDGRAVPAVGAVRARHGTLQ